MKQGPPFNFFGIPADFDSAKIVILPVPYESTVSYKSGTKDGPHEIIHASRFMETYDLELDSASEDIGIYTLDELEKNVEGPEKMINNVEEAVSEILDKNKFVIMLGGEHSITLGAFRAHFKKFKNLSLLQLDAHADLREEFEGSKYNHACVMRRCGEITKNIVQVGIRSCSNEESEYMQKEKIKIIHKAPAFDIKTIISQLNENVYLTIDVDCFDPAIMPSTGTPEPGGLQYYQVLELIKAVAKKRKIVGMDVVELSPIPGIAAPNFMVAKLIQKCMGYIFQQKA